MRAAIPLLLLLSFMACTGTTLPFISTPLQSGLALYLTPSTATLEIGDHSASRRVIYRKLYHVNIKREPGC